MKLDYQVQLQKEETQARALARTVTTPESLSAAVLCLSKNIALAGVNEMVDELKKQSAAVHANDLSRAESMLIAQAHTLDGLFAKLSSHALTSTDMDKFERYLKLALRSQAQARATLQTLGELKAPKQVAFVGQANIGQQVQVNNHAQPAEEKTARARKKQTKPNKLLEKLDGDRMDTRKKGTASGANTVMAAVEKQHRTGN